MKEIKYRLIRVPNNYYSLGGEFRLFIGEAPALREGGDTLSVIELSPKVYMYVLTNFLLDAEQQTSTEK